MTKILQDVNLGTNLKRLRKSKGLTQEEVCAKLALAGRPMLQNNYAQIETGKRNIFLSDLIALKEIYNVSYEEFFINLKPVSKYDSEKTD